MGGRGLDLDDLDQALTGLAAPTSPASSPRSATPITIAPLAGPAGPPPLSPPPVRSRLKPGKDAPQITPGQWNGRTPFDDLFVSDAAPLPSARGGLEEKVEYFREKLKRSEAFTARFRDAWQTREKELDVLEAMMTQERGKAEDLTTKVNDLTQKLQALETFVDQKKREFEAYGQKVAQAFAQREDQDKELKRQIEQKSGELEGVRNQLQVANDELEHERRVHTEDSKALNEQLAERDSRFDEADKKNAELSQEIEVAREELLDTKQALEHDIGVRNESIEKLKASVESQRTALTERDQQIEQLNAQVATFTDELNQMRADLDMARQTGEHDVQVRDEAIGKLKEGIERQRAGIAERDEQLTGLREQNEAKDAQLAEITEARDQAVRDIQMRDQAIENLKSAIESQRAVLDERDSTITRLEGELTQGRETLKTTEESLTHDVKTRDEAIEKLKTAVESQREHITEVESQLASAQDQSAQDRQRAGDLLTRSFKALEVAQKLLGA